MSQTPPPEKGGATAGRWRSLPPKLLTAALLVVFLLWSIDAFVVSGGARPTAIHLGSYLGTYHATTARPLLKKSYPPIAKPANTSAADNRRRCWISASFPAHFTAALLSRWLAPGGEPCRDSRTANISILTLDGGSLIALPAGDVHEFTMLALDEAGRPRCLGGDYFETDLSGESWKSRPPVADHGNGSYSVRLQVHPDFVGDYTLTIVLLFRSFEGLKFSPERFKYRRVLRRIQVRISPCGHDSLPELQTCRSSDFSREVWSGRWTRLAKQDRCPVDDEGRYRCLAPDFPCRRPWCGGPLGALESNGWVYSAHCSFKIFTKDSAWRCLNNKWVFFWGDSNHVDTIRNLLNFVLGRADVAVVPRRFDTRFANPSNGSESVRITSIFNGHWNESMNYLGLQSLQNGEFRQLLWKYFSEEKVPDAMLLNSGLHDGVYWSSIRAFAKGAEHAARFWEEVMNHVRKRVDGTSMAMPRLFYRTTVATGGYARDLAFNPSKMEAFNGVLIEKLKEKGLISGGVIDEFDMTFPWHFDNRCNDGVHYGRRPAKRRWRDGEVGHHYFVDLMLGHVLLNAICDG